MPVDWTDQSQIDNFRTVAVSKGFDGTELDKYISEKRAGLITPTEKVEKVETKSVIPDSVAKQNIGVLQPTKQNSVAQPTAIPTTQPTGKGIGDAIGDARLTQPFGNRSNIEKYSGGVNLGTDWAVPANTPLPAPSKGSWVVQTASPGWNGGSGNYVKIKNTQTGETIEYEHLNKINVRPGQEVTGMTVGLSGGGQSGSGKGNSTGWHASIPYKDASGKYKDIRNTPYF